MKVESICNLPNSPGAYQNPGGAFRFCQTPGSFRSRRLSEPSESGLQRYWAISPGVMLSLGTCQSLSASAFSEPIGMEVGVRLKPWSWHRASQKSVQRRISSTGKAENLESGRSALWARTHFQTILGNRATQAGALSGPADSRRPVRLCGKFLFFRAEPTKKFPELPELPDSEALGSRQLGQLGELFSRSGEQM